VGLLRISGARAPLVLSVYAVNTLFAIFVNFVMDRPAGSGFGRLLHRDVCT
jgi:hypothetical protein